MSESSSHNTVIPLRTLEIRNRALKNAMRAHVGGGMRQDDEAQTDRMFGRGGYDSYRCAAAIAR